MRRKQYPQAAIGILARMIPAGFALGLMLASLQPSRLQAQTNGVLREVYGGIAGTTIADLTNNPAYPDNPTSTNFVTDFFEAPINTADYYGQRMRGFVIAPATGSYIFWISSDDDGSLYLSTDETPANKQLIAYVSGWTNPREWGKFASQQSAAIPLTAGQRYYVEALMKEGSGGDNLAVRWQLPNATIEEPIPASRLLPWGTSFTPPVITQQPTNTTAVEGQPATFFVRVSNLDPTAYQWRRGVANMPGANSSSYTLPAVALSDNGAQFSCFLTNSLGSTNSTAATLLVTPDTNAPTLFSAQNVGSTNVKVIFSEPVAVATATTATNYLLNNGATISAAAFGSDTRTILLTTSP
ncbi:MAG: PA14 domain-containing protein, partial [Verrucomicrobiota bacterium]